MRYYVYILESIDYFRYYIGQTKDLTSRVKFHNGTYAKWTKRFQPWKLIYSEVYEFKV